MPLFYTSELPSPAQIVPVVF